MKMRTVLTISIFLLSSGCTPEEPEVTVSLAGGGASTEGPQTGSEEGVEKVSEPIQAEIENFDMAELVFSQGMVRALNESNHSKETASIAQAVVVENQVDMREGAKVLVFEEPRLNRVIFQSHDTEGKLTGVYTLLADKETNKMINGYLGWYMGPPEDPR